ALPVRAGVGVGVLGVHVDASVARAGGWGPAAAEAGGLAAAWVRAALGTAPPVGGGTGGAAASGPGRQGTRVTTGPRRRCRRCPRCRRRGRRRGAWPSAA